MPHIVLNNVSKEFQAQAARTAALANIDLSVERGEFVCIVGPSGCGKSTLLNLIGGFAAPTGGRLLVNNTSISGPDKRRIMLFQESTLLPWKTVLGNVLFGVRASGRLSRKERCQHALELIARVGLKGFELHYPRQLSGGMRQRIVLARALAAQPEMLLMDEPFGALDALTRLQIQQELLDVWKRSSITVVLVTHCVEEAMLLGQRVLVMSQAPGRIMAEYDLTQPVCGRNKEQIRDSILHDLGVFQKQRLWTVDKEISKPAALWSA